jgi:hypothetical protein
VFIDVPVPKTAMHKDDFFTSDENYIRIAWQVAPMKSVSVAKAVQKPPDKHFRLRVTATHAAHEGTTLFCGKNVHPGSTCEGLRAQRHRFGIPGFKHAVPDNRPSVCSIIAAIAITWSSVACLNGACTNCAEEFFSRMRRGKTAGEHPDGARCYQPVPPLTLSYCVLGLPSPNVISLFEFLR